MKKIENKKGFTLIELLTIIVVLSLIISFSIYIVTSVVGNAKEKSYDVTVNNIVNVASGFVIENLGDKVSWMDKEDNENVQYTCVNVQDLIDGGYYKSDILESYKAKDKKVSKDDYIYLERDVNSKSIITKKLSIDNELDSLCNEDDDLIKIKVSKHDDCPVISGWSKCKLVNIEYRITNITDSSDLSKHEYSYSFIRKDKSTISKIESNPFNNYVERVEFKAEENGEIIALIDASAKSKEIKSIDNKGPKIESLYNGNKVVNDTVTIPLKVTDLMVNNEGKTVVGGVGVDGKSFTINDLVITIGGKTITDGVIFTKIDNNNYTLRIDNSTDTGVLDIVVAENNVLDLLGNGSSKFELNKDKTDDEKIQFNNRYLISYEPNGGSGFMNPQVVSFGDSVSISNNKFTRSGYTFVGWTTKSDGTDDGYNWTGWSGTWNYKNGEKGIANNELVLYARWRKNKVTIKYSVNGGIIQSNINNKYYWDSEGSENLIKGIIRKKESNTNTYNVLTTVVDYGGKLGTDGLVNYNNSNYINITRVGYVGVNGAEWICLSDNCKGNTYDQVSQYDVENFCNAKDKDCTVVLGVNWKLDEYTISYNSNGGSGFMNPQVVSFGDSVSISNNKFTRSGYTFVGWTTKSEGTDDGYNWTGWSGTWNYKNGEKGIANNELVLYARWRKNKVTIKYSVNDGTIQSKTNDNNDTYYWDSNGSENLIKGIIRKKESNTNTYNVFTTVVDYGGKLGTDGLVNYNYSNYINIIRKGYSGVNGAEWICLSNNCKGNTYNQTSRYNADNFCNAKDKDCTVVLGVNWKLDEYTISYDANGGSGAPDDQIKEAGVTLRLSSIVPTRKGYKFIGWSENSKATTASYQAGGSYTKDADGILYAVWVGNSYKIDYEVNIFSPFDSSRSIRTGNVKDTDGDGKLDESLYMLDINYDPVTSNLKFNTIIPTSRINGLPIGINPLTFYSGDEYEIILTYVSGTYTGDAGMSVVAMSNPNGSGVIQSASVKLPTSTNKVVSKSIKFTSKSNAYLKQIMTSSNSLNVKFTDYVVNVVIRKKAEGLSQEFIYGTDTYNIPDELNVPVKLGYKKITSWRLLNNSSWGDYVSDDEEIAIAADHKVYAILQKEILSVYYDGNGKSINYSPTTYIYDTYDVESEKKAKDEVSIRTYDKDDKSTFDGWRFKIKPFADSNVELWFGCSNKYVNEDNPEYKISNKEECWGQTNLSLGWYEAKDIAIYYTRGRNGSSAGALNKANFLGFDVYAVAQWK